MVDKDQIIALLHSIERQLKFMKDYVFDEHIDKGKMEFENHWLKEKIKITIEFKNDP
jgi:hypothetical protein